MKVLAFAVIILATSSTASECGADLPKSCTVLFRGLDVENGRVTDVVRPVCDNGKRPLSHVIEVYLDYRSVSDEFTPLERRHKVVSQIPDEEGFDIIVSGPCLEGYYRTHYYVSGRGAPLDGGPGGSLSFEYEDTGWSKYFDVGGLWRMTTQGWLVVIALVLYVLWRGYRCLYRYPYKLCTYPGCDGGRLKSRSLLRRRTVSGLCHAATGRPGSRVVLAVAEN